MNRASVALRFEDAANASCLRSRPISVILAVVPIVITLAFSPLLLGLTIETRAAEIWVAEGTDALRDRGRYVNLMGELSRVSQVIFAPPVGVDNIWTKDSLEDFLNASMEIELIRAAAGGRERNASNQLWDVCERSEDDYPCNRISAADCFAEGEFVGWSSPGVWRSQIDISFQAPYVRWVEGKGGIRQALADFADDEALRDFNAFKSNGCFNFGYQTLAQSMFLGGLELDAARRVERVGALQSVYTLKARTSAEAEASKAWEERLERFVLEEAPGRYEHLRLLVRTDGLIDKVIEDVASRDRWIFPFGFGLMVLYVCASQAVASDASERAAGVVLGVLGVVYVAASVLTALALAAATTTITPVSVQVLPFIAISVGVDDMFIVLSEHRRARRAGRGLAHALGTAGPTTLLTAAVVALMYASCLLSSTTPAVVEFLKQAALCTLVSWLFVLTSVPATIALVFPEAGGGAGAGAAAVAPASASSKEPSSSAGDAKLSSGFAALGVQLSGRVAAALLLPGFLILFGVFAHIAATKVDIGIEFSSVVPKSDQSFEFFELFERYFTASGAYLVVEDQGSLDLGVAGADVMLAVEEFGETTEYVDVRSNLASFSWLHWFIAYLNGWPVAPEDWANMTQMERDIVSTIRTSQKFEGFGPLNETGCARTVVASTPTIFGRTKKTLKLPPPELFYPLFYDYFLQTQVGKALMGSKLLERDQGAVAACVEADKLSCDCCGGGGCACRADSSDSFCDKSAPAAREASPATAAGGASDEGPTPVCDVTDSALIGAVMALPPDVVNSACIPYNSNPAPTLAEFCACFALLEKSAASAVLGCLPKAGDDKTALELWRQCPYEGDLGAAAPECDIGSAELVGAVTAMPPEVLPRCLDYQSGTATTLDDFCACFAPMPETTAKSVLGCRATADANETALALWRRCPIATDLASRRRLAAAELVRDEAYYYARPGPRHASDRSEEGVCDAPMVDKSCPTLGPCVDPDCVAGCNFTTRCRIEHCAPALSPGDREEMWNDCMMDCWAYPERATIGFTLGFECALYVELAKVNDPAPEKWVRYTCDHGLAAAKPVIAHAC